MRDLIGQFRFDSRDRGQLHLSSGKDGFRRAKHLQQRGSMNGLEAFHHIQCDPMNHAEHINTPDGSLSFLTQPSIPKICGCAAGALSFILSMKKLALVLILVPILLAAGDPKYDLWLQNEGYYLLTSQQKDKFKAMSDQEKELFIQNLWASLDPDPVTPE